MNAGKLALINTGIKVGGTALAVGAGYLLIRKLLKGKANSDGTSTKVAPTLKSMRIESSGLSITTSDAALYASTLYTAMVDFGTEEEIIYSVIDKVKTRNDMLLVIRTFGVKKYLWGSRAAFIGQNINLVGWLRAELSSREIARIKPKFDNWGIPL